MIHSLDSIRSGQPLTDPLRQDAKPWQARPRTQMLAASAALLPAALLLVWMNLVQGRSFTLEGLFIWPLLGGGSLILWILFLHILVSGDSLDGLGLRRAGPWLDLLLGGVGSLLLLAFSFGFQATLARALPPRPPVPEVLELLSGVSRNPLLLALWLGPVVWIGVAGFEELWRAFMLRRLWRIWGGKAGRWVVLLCVSALVGLAHTYQGAAAVVSIGLMSVFMGWFYLATGRLRALIVAHALYDSIQIAMAVIAIRAGRP